MSVPTLELICWVLGILSGQATEVGGQSELCVPLGPVHYLAGGGVRGYQHSVESPGSGDGWVSCRQ